MLNPTRAVREFAGALGALLVLMIIFSAAGPAHAEDAKFGPTPSSAGAAAFFVDLKDGATIPTRAVIRFGVRNMDVAPAGSDRPNSGHYHLLVDTGLPPLDKPIPADLNHLHFGAGETEAAVTLEPGEHSLQLLMGDSHHIPHNPPIMSDRIKVKVVDATSPAPAAAAYPRKPSPAGARVYFISPTNGAVVARNTIVRFGLTGMGVAPAGDDRANSGHHHLLVDAPLPPLDQPVPNDFNHLHFGTGQTEAKVTLPLGVHTLQLLLADANHVPHSPPVFSQRIKVLVTATGRRPRPRVKHRFPPRL